MKNLFFLLAFSILFFQNANAETEPNDSPAQANILTISGSQNGTVSGADSHDWFWLQVPQSGTLTLPFNITTNGWVWLRLYDGETATPVLVTEIYASTDGQPSADHQLVRAVLPGKYFVDVQHAGPACDYVLAAQFAASAFPADAEPNDNAAQALAMPPNGTTTGNVWYYRPTVGVDLEDWYKMNVPAGGILKMNIHKRGYQPTGLHFRDGQKPGNPDIVSPPIYLDWNDSPPQGWNWEYPVLAGTYLFQLTANNSSLDYSFVSTLELPVWGEDAEPNNAILEAKPLAIGDSTGGLIGYYQPGTGADLEDWFEVETPTAGLLSFDISKNGYQPANAYLHNAGGQIAEQYLNWGAATENLKKAVPAGKYWLVFKKGSGDFQYKVAATFLPAPVAGFTFNSAGNTVAFENLSTGKNLSFSWNFDDGKTSTAVNPLHEFQNPGDFDVCLIATNPGGADTFCQIQIVPGLASIRPNSGGNTGQVSISVFGGGLDTTFFAKIMSGATVIAQSNFTKKSGKGNLQFRFDLNGKPIGQYDFVVEKAGGNPSYKLTNGFKIVAGNAPDVWVSVGGRNRILFNTWTTYTINYGNNGNVDARTAPIWLSFSRGQGLDVKFENVEWAQPDSTVSGPPTDGFYVDLDSLFGQPNAVRVYPLLIPRIAGNSSNSFQIKVKTGGNLKIHAWAEKPWYQSPINQNKMECVGDALNQIPDSLGIDFKDKVECTKIFTAIIFDQVMDSEWNNYYEYGDKKPNFISNLLLVVGAAAQICGVKDSTDRKKISGWTANVIANYFLKGAPTQAKVLGGGQNCPAEFAPQNPQTTSLTAVTSLDPNEKTGAQGFGAANFVAPLRAVPYTIFFENKPDATAPAHTVVVSDLINWLVPGVASSISLGPITIGDSVIYPSAGVLGYVYDYENFIPGKVTLRVTVGFDMFLPMLTWRFQSLDPVTLAEIEDPDLGFLPPNLNGTEGQGSVSFTIALAKPMTDGKQFSNQASIVFDANAPILTNEHFVTCDAVVPESSVSPLPNSTTTEQFPVSWNGSDAGSGLQFFNIYVSENGLPDSLWLGRTTANSAIFTGKMGNSYSFYSVAVDNVGNAEAAPIAPDAQISVLVGTNDLADAAGISVFPNPASERLNVVFKNENRGVFQLFRPDGTVVFSQKMDGGRRLEIPVSGLPTGVYFWKWADENGETVSGKVLVAR